MCTSHEETGPEFEATYTVCRATLARIETYNALTEGGKKPRPFERAYLWITRVLDRR